MLIAQGDKIGKWKISMVGKYVLQEKTISNLQQRVNQICIRLFICDISHLEHYLWMLTGFCVDQDFVGNFLFRRLKKGAVNS